MALQNIGVSNQDDAFYRYKMPKLITKVEGRGNGIKTNLSNMVDVAKALGRPPAYTTKYFGCELGAQSKFDEKTGTAIVNGAHETGKLAALLENFIKKYVQCYGCGNPETEILISKSQLISLKCAACGYVSDVDMRDKLTNFILKNPPEQKKKDKKGMRKAEKERLKAGEALDEEMKKSKKELKVKKIHEGNSNVSTKKKVPDGDVEGHSPASSQRDESEEDEDEDVVEWQTDTSALAAQQRIKEQLTAATSELVMLINADNGEQKLKATEKKTCVNSSGNDEHRLNGAVKKTSKEVAASGKETTDSLVVKSHDIYKALVKEFRKCIDDEFDEKQLVKRLYSVHPHSSEQEVMNAYFEALFQGISKGLPKEINKKKLFLAQAMVRGEHSQRLLLGAMEAYCSSGSLQLQKEISAVLKMLYDLDILEEDDIVTWYNGVSENIDVKKFAKPFVDWLQSAESEED